MGPENRREGNVGGIRESGRRKEDWIMPFRGSSPFPARRPNTYTNSLSLSLFLP
jgi:hypothetical protein